MPNTWVQTIKKIQKEKNISYKDAMILASKRRKEQINKTKALPTAHRKQQKMNPKPKQRSSRLKKQKPLKKSKREYQAIKVRVEGKGPRKYVRQFGRPSASLYYSFAKQVGEIARGIHKKEEDPIEELNKYNEALIRSHDFTNYDMLENITLGPV